MIFFYRIFVVSLDVGIVGFWRPWYNTRWQSLAQYWPEENEECECGPFLIETMATDREDEDIVVRQLQLNYYSPVCAFLSLYIYVKNTHKTWNKFIISWWWTTVCIHRRVQKRSYKHPLTKTKRQIQSSHQVRLKRTTYQPTSPLRFATWPTCNSPVGPIKNLFLLPVFHSSDWLKKFMICKRNFLKNQSSSTACECVYEANVFIYQKLVY